MTATGAATCSCSSTAPPARPGYTFDDYRAITAPTLILTGDRDHFCSVEEAVVAYRNLPAGELAVLPHTDHVITPAIVDTTIEFLLRHVDD